MDSGNSESLQSSSDEHESSSTGALADHSSFFLPPFSSSSSSSTTYLNFVNNLISGDILVPPSPPPPLPLPLPPKPSSSSSRNPRKRTRASRRAPTTVLTTNTCNFRAMVQEFTGLPSSPFSSSTRRFDIFRSPSQHHHPLSFNPFHPSPLHQQPSSPSSLFNHTNFHSHPNLTLPQTHQVSTLHSLLSHHHNTETTLESMNHSMNLGALNHNQNHNNPEDEHRFFMMRQDSSSSSAQIRGSSGTNTTTVVEPWISPTDSNQ
ncbi:unnamed protein product [Cochlearia groenlandica]